MKKSLSEALSEEELAQLDVFLLGRIDDEAADRMVAAGGDEGVIDLSELDGFLTALVSGPNVIVPSIWLPAVWGDAIPAWESEDEFEEIFGLIIRHQNSIVATLLYAPQTFEPMFDEREAEGNTHQMVHQWCHGYMRGVALDAAAWGASETDLGQLLFPILLWGTEEGWPNLQAMSEEDQESEKDAIPESVRALHKYWLDRRAPQTEPVRRDSPKVGRNDPCPCGSGKKYKHCCLQ